MLLFSQFCFSFSVSPFFIFTLFLSILLHPLCSRPLTFLSLSVVASFVAAVVPQPPFPHNCGSLCRCNFVSLVIFADAVAQAHRIFDGKTSSRGY